MDPVGIFVYVLFAAGIGFVAGGSMLAMRGRWAKRILSLISAVVIPPAFIFGVTVMTPPNTINSRYILDDWNMRIVFAICGLAMWPIALWLRHKYGWFRE